MKAYAQKRPESFGYNHHQITFQNDTVHILSRSKKGEDQIKKPVLLFIQGSKAKPLLIYNDETFLYPSPLENNIEDDYHLVMVNKPGIPLMAHQDSLGKGRQFIDKVTGKVPTTHTVHNNLEYYVERNNKVIEYLMKQQWVDTTKIIVAGHSEGSSIAVHLAAKNTSVTHLIYSGGTPYYPRILAMVRQERDKEMDSANVWVERSFSYWEDVLDHPFDTSRSHGWNSYKGTYSFSQNENEIIKRLKIPVLITYGTKDEAAPFNDMFRIETMKDRKDHITFKAYIGLEHNFFGLHTDGSIDYNQFNWDKVVKDWFAWLN
ncbi:MAG: dienelactone hydrolase family protein [Bacteroidota bacterium]